MHLQLPIAYARFRQVEQVMAYLNASNRCGARTGGAADRVRRLQ